MKRSPVNLDDVARWDNLVAAAWRAAEGKRDRPEVAEFMRSLTERLRCLQADILSGTVQCGVCRRFEIRDPKRREITAPCFRERVLHHALMAWVAPVLERSLVADTFACIRGRGTHAAVRRCLDHVRRFAWHAKMDIRRYFPSIDHERLKELLRRKFKDRGVLALIDRIIDAHETEPGKGLPIGALTSQCFANFYLGGLDRFLMESRRVCGYARYMDDFVFWSDSRREIIGQVTAVKAFLAAELRLVCREDTEINRSVAGVTICGFRVTPCAIRLARTRKDGYLRARKAAEHLWLAGKIGGAELQRRFDAALGITAGAAARGWLAGREVLLAGDGWREEV